MLEEKISFEKVITNQILNNCDDILLLIDFLKQYDKKFEEFIPISYISLKNNLSYEDEKSFDLALSQLTKIPIENMPTIEIFINIIIKNGADPKKFNNLSLIQDMLKAYIYKEKLSSKGLIASLILSTNF